MGITTNKPAARCLDLTRLVSRVGRGPWTGIDRVEFEYLKVLAATDITLFALVRIADGQAVLEPENVLSLLARLDGSRQWGQPDLASRFLRKSNSTHRRAVSDIRRLSTRVVWKAGLVENLGDCFPAGTAYLNVGHCNISADILSAFRNIPGTRITVLLHDTIPLDFPQYQRPETVSAFSVMLQLMAEYSDLMLCNSEQTRKCALSHLAGSTRMPEMTVAYLGITNALPRMKDLPTDLDLSHPYFVTIGTIEPRKNHRLLLNIWERLTKNADAPRLFIVGQRGWRNEVVFQRLDGHPNGVYEFGDLSDGAVAAMLVGARALLFPSHAEGFGLPVAEAKKLGVPVICSELPVFREIFGEYPIYADVSDLYDWETKIGNLAINSEAVNNGESRLGQARPIPTWGDHFNLVLRLT